MAADDCSNAKVRAQQQSQRLPNCMAYERVSPDDTGGAAPLAPGTVHSGPPVAGLSEDGTRVLMKLSAGAEDAQNFATVDWRRGSRGDGGWTTTSLLPPMNEPRLVSGIDDSRVASASADLERVLVSTAFPLAPQDRGEMVPGFGGSTDLYLRDPDGTLTWLVPDPNVPDTSTAAVKVIGASPDLERVALRTSRPFDPRVTTTWVDHYYVWSREHGMQLATVLPDGSLATSTSIDVTVSDDGRRVAFAAGGKLYVRFDADDPAKAVTREVAVGRNGETCADAAFVRLGENLPMREGLSRDGTQVLFECNGAMEPGGPGFGSTVPYIRDLDGGPAAVRQFEHYRVVVEAADDFSWVYTRVPPTVSDTRNSAGFLLGRGGTSRPAVPPAVVPGALGSFKVVASADGEFLAFESGGDFALPGVDPGPPDRAQVYLYSAARDELRCVSCRLDGAPTEHAGDLGTPGSVRITDRGSVPVSDRGEVTFTTASALVPEDTNGVEDAYAWIDGRPVLLSGGRSGDPSLALGMTRDGRSFLLTTPDALAVDDRDGGYDLYLARANGGWLASEPPASCTSNCQAPGAGRPGSPAVGTANVLPNGNLIESVAPKRSSATLTASRSVRGTSTTVRVKVSRAGSIRVSGNGLRQATVKAKKAGTYRVTVRLSVHGLRQQKKRGRLVTKVSARFTPKSGASASVRKSVTFTRATTKKGGR